MEGDGKHYQIYTATSGRNLDDYQRLVIAWRNGAPIRLGDVAEITDGPQDLRTLGLFNGSPAVIVLLRKKPGANVIAAVDQLRALLPELQAELPSAVKLRTEERRVGKECVSTCRSRW